MHTIRTLMPWERAEYGAHLLRLGSEDRRLRFGHALSDDALERFVDAIDPLHSRILVHCDDDSRVVAAACVASVGAAAVELAFSVESSFRNQGVGSALCERALIWARNRGRKRAYVCCLPENVAMRRLAQHFGMAMRFDGEGCEGSLDLPPPTLLTLLRDWGGEALGAYMIVIHQQGQTLRRFYPAAA